MAINKKKSSPLVKTGIIVISGMIILAFLPWDSLAMLFNGGSTTSGGTQGTLDGISAKYTGQVSGLEQVLASEPTSYTALVNLGNTYFDWGIAVQKTKVAGADKPMWVSATVYYDRALDAAPGDPAVTTDASIAHYYAGDNAQAIVLIEPIMKSAPTFAPAFFNAAIFYDTAGRTAEAAAAANAYLKLDSGGQSGDPELAKSIAAKASGATTTTP